MPVATHTAAATVRRSAGGHRFLQAERVGLDIGRTAIKAVRLHRSWNGRESVTYLHQALPHLNGRPLEAAELGRYLRTFLLRHQLTDVPIVTSIPCRDLFLRTLTFPFRDSKKLAQVAPFEVEPLIPVPLEDVSVNCLVHPPAEGEQGKLSARQSDVLVAAAPRARVSEYTAFLAGAGLDPTSIHVDALALSSTVRQLGQEGSLVPANLAIIDIGATKTTLCLTHKKRPWLLRTIAWGSNNLTEALAQKYGCSLGEAERRKRELTASDVGMWFSPLVGELQRSLHAYQANTGTQIKRAWFCGGGSKLRGLPVSLGRHLDLKPLGTRAGFGLDAPRAFAVAYGLAVRPRPVAAGLRFGASASGAALDLKQVATAAETQDEGRRQDLWLMVGGAVLVAALVLADLSFRVALKDNRVKELRAAVHTQYREQFGGTAPDGLELDQARSHLATTKETLELFGRPEGRVLPTLAEVVRRLPKEAPVKIRALTVDQMAVQLEAETSSFEAVEKVKQALGRSAAFAEVAVSDARVGAARNQVLFRVTLKHQVQ